MVKFDDMGIQSGPFVNSINRPFLHLFCSICTINFQLFPYHSSSQRNFYDHLLWHHPSSTFKSRTFTWSSSSYFFPFSPVSSTFGPILPSFSHSISFVYSLLFFFCLWLLTIMRLGAKILMTTRVLDCYLLKPSPRISSGHY